jgi:hypothetical protein
MCICTHVLHNIGTLAGQKKCKLLEQQWMPRAKEIFSLGILGTRALGWSALLCVEVLFNKNNKPEGLVL